jgi:hypothetical protein
MQVFINRSELTRAPQEVVRVITCLGDDVSIPSTTYPGATILSLPKAAIVNVSGGQELAPGWRDAYRMEIARGEADRRIRAAFPEDAQRLSQAEMLSQIMAGGADPAKWPQDAQRRRVEFDRAWAYVAAVRRAADNLAHGDMSGDPTANSRWPTPAAPYKVG